MQMVLAMRFCWQISCGRVCFYVAISKSLRVFCCDGSNSIGINLVTSVCRPGILPGIVWHHVRSGGAKTAKNLLNRYFSLRLVC
jgi:hypothetical protein